MTFSTNRLKVLQCRDGQKACTCWWLASVPDKQRMYMYRTFRSFIQYHFLQQVTAHQKHSATGITVLTACTQLMTVLDCVSSMWLMSYLGGCSKAERL